MVDTGYKLADELNHDFQINIKKNSYQYKKGNMYYYTVTQSQLEKSLEKYGFDKTEIGQATAYLMKKDAKSPFSELKQEFEKDRSNAKKDFDAYRQDLKKDFNQTTPQQGQNLKFEYTPQQITECPETHYLNENAEYTIEKGKIVPHANVNPNEMRRLKPDVYLNNGTYQCGPVSSDNKGWLDTKVNLELKELAKAEQVYKALQQKEGLSKLEKEFCAGHENDLKARGLFRGKDGRLKQADQQTPSQAQMRNMRSGR